MRSALALVDSGSQVTTISEGFYNNLNPPPPVIPEQEVNLEGPDGRSLPYINCIALTVAVDVIAETEIVAPALVVPTTDYHKEVLAIVGTNIISRYQAYDDNMESIPSEWQRAFLALQA